MPVPAPTFLAPTFVAPPSFDGGDPTEAAQPSRSPEPSSRPRSAPPARGLRMTRGARRAAAGMRVSENDIQRCIDAPDDSSPDPDTPSRTHFRRGRLIVLASADGMILRVSHPDR